MASHHGLLPSSKEVVLEIQLNKLINDFLFSGVENRNATVGRDAEGKDASKPMICSNDDPHCNVENPSWKMDSPSRISLENGDLAEDLCNSANSSCITDGSLPIPAVVGAHGSSNAAAETPEGSKGMPSIHSKAASLPTLEEVRLDMTEQSSSSCSEDKLQHTNKLKIFCLSRAHSVAGSLFCFAMERREQYGERKQERKTKLERGSIKLTRTGSLPCHSKLNNEAEIEVKHTCRKPPRPPRSSSMKGPCADAVFVLHSTSRRARLERRKKLAASSSSNASFWALIFTFCFALAMIGEGFWSQSSTMLAVDPHINATAAHSHLNPTTLPSPLKTSISNNLHVSSQLEKEMQMREFWISKGLDPS